MSLFERPYVAGGLTLRALINSALPPAAAINCAAAAAGKIKLLEACDGTLLSIHATLLVYAAARISFLMVPACSDGRVEC